MKTLLTALFLCLLVTANAQSDSTARPRIVGVSFNIAPSWRIASDLTAFNNALQSAGLPKINTTLRATDLGFGFLYNRWYVQFHAKVYHSLSNDKYNTMGGYGSELRFQYNLSSSKKVFFGPFLGFSGDSFQFNFDDPNQRTFQTALQSPGTVAHTKVNVFGVINGTAGFGIYSMQSLNRGLHSSVGLEAGYTFGSSGVYRVNDELVQSPSSTFSGLDIRVVLRFFVLRPRPVTGK